MPKSAANKTLWEVPAKNIDWEDIHLRVSDTVKATMQDPMSVQSQGSFAHYATDAADKNIDPDKDLPNKPRFKR